jgi:hypothetical protein
MKRAGAARFPALFFLDGPGRFDSLLRHHAICFVFLYIDSV